MLAKTIMSLRIIYNIELHQLRGPPSITTLHLQHDTSQHKITKQMAPLFHCPLEYARCAGCLIFLDRFACCLPDASCEVELCDPSWRK